MENLASTSEFRLVYANECPRCSDAAFYVMGTPACAACTKDYPAGTKFTLRDVTYEVIEWSVQKLDDWWADEEDCPRCKRLTEYGVEEAEAADPDEYIYSSDKCDCCEEDYVAFLAETLAQTTVALDLRHKFPRLFKKEDLADAVLVREPPAL